MVFLYACGDGIPIVQGEITRHSYSVNFWIPSLKTTKDISPVLAPGATAGNGKREIESTDHTIDKLVYELSQGDDIWVDGRGNKHCGG
jgi:hypothetical protein